MSLQVLMAGVCVLSVFSITHTFHLLSEASDHAMKTSLNEFTTPKQVDAAEDQDLVIAPPLLHKSGAEQQLQDKVEGLEMPIDNPPVPNGTDTFAACLLVMDDNNRIVSSYRRYKTSFLREGISYQPHHDKRQSDSLSHTHKFPNFQIIFLPRSNGLPIIIISCR